MALVIGVNPAAQASKASFALMAMVSNGGSSGGIYRLDSTGANSQADKIGELITLNGKSTTTLVSGLDPLTNTSLLNYTVLSSTAGKLGVVSQFNGASDTSDALLTFAVPFSAINTVLSGSNYIAAGYNTSNAFGVNTLWNFSAAVFTGVSVSSGTTSYTGAFDAFASNGSTASSSLTWSDSIAANGSTGTTSSYNTLTFYSAAAEVPEESTAILLPALLGPVAGIAFWRRRAAKRAAQAKVAAAS